MTDLAPALDVLRDRVPGLQAVYVFGSAATGATHPESDVDLAVLARRPLGAVERFEIQEAAASALGTDVDLVDLRAATTVMRAEVLRTDRVVLDLDPVVRARFEMQALSAYAQLNQERAGILADIAARGRVHGTTTP